MTVWMFLSFLGIVYSLLYLIDTLMRSHSSTSFKYLLKMRRLGLEVSLFQVKWFTSKYNSTFQQIAFINPRLTNIWFKVGGVVSTLLIVPSIVLLCYSIHQQVVPQANSTVSVSKAVLQPVVPGVNLPPSELLYYLFALLFSSIWHEIGHAIAAYDCGVPVLGVGLLIMAVFPAAYVELPTPQLLTRSHRHQLAVYSAGVWHNVVLAVIAWLLGYMAPTLLSLFYSWGNGVVIASVLTEGSVSGPSGLMEGDLLMKMQGKVILNIRDYKQVLAEVISKPQVGLCISEELIHNITLTSQSGVKNLCCPQERSDSLCFHGVKSGRNQCLPVRKVLDGSRSVFCDMWDPFQNSDEGVCESGFDCMVPQLSVNHSKLIIVERKSKKDFLFVGHPVEIFIQTEVTNFLPNYSFLPICLPDIFIKVCRYVASFSSALAVLNVVPSYLLDGYHMIRVLTDMGFKHFQRSTSTLVAGYLSLFGTLIIALNILLGLKALLAPGMDYLTNF